MLTKYGIDNIIVMLIAGFVLITISAFFIRGWISILLFILGLILVVMTFIFFRDPERKIPLVAIDNENIILSPADGKVVDISETYENYYINGSCIKISIFLSPLDVHVNRSPVTGIVEFYKYIKGDYLVAYHPKSSELNEQSIIGVKTIYGKVVFKQIVGILARRLVCDLKEGDSIKAGERFGMMKFGSRMDVFFEKNAEINVKIGDKVVGGVSILAKMKLIN
ncbi:MAG: phosphatidylserine decarboxylase family protein [Candidatus Kapabacteria bacterium]|nr:phosphatidylserine decarboxylase family protein [Candidatus Kapabacteria bacterium]